MRTSQRLLPTLAILLVSFLLSSGRAEAADPTCGSVPCISIIPKSGNSGCDQFEMLDMLNHAPRAATVKVQMYDNGKPTQRIDTIESPAGSTHPLGCSGAMGNHRYTWSILSIVWH